MTTRHENRLCGTFPAFALVFALTALTACDPQNRRDAESERGSRLYQSAAADYQAGRIDAAIEGFRKTVREEPANAEARFQLACLLHDTKKDMTGAFCAYSEYLSQHPSGDKAALARKRLAMCERELAAILAGKYGLAAGGASGETVKEMHGEIKSAKERAAKAEKELAEAKNRTAALEEERARLLAMIKNEGAESVSASARPDVKEIKDLLDDDGGETAPPSAGDVAALRGEEALELASAASLLAPRSAEDTAALKKAAAEKDAEKKSALAPQRPETYEVREGDTLYKIAMKFYGTIHAWRKIREANKALISTDGRVRAGDTIKLP